MFTVRSWTFSTSSTSRKRSCVSGRRETMPCWAKAIAVASTAPIQIGRYLSPCASFSKTMGLFDGISTRTPMTSICRTTAPSSRAWGTSAWPPLPLPRYTRNRPEADRSPPAGGPVASGARWLPWGTWAWWDGLDPAGPKFPKFSAGSAASSSKTRACRGAEASPASASADSTSVACSRKVRSAICHAVLAAASRAPGPRCRSWGATTCSTRLASRSAAALTARRCLACTPYWRSAATARATASASPPYCRPTRRIRP